MPNNLVFVHLNYNQMEEQNLFSIIAQPDCILSHYIYTNGVSV